MEIKTRPLVVGWVPTKKKVEMIMDGRESELPGAWLYALQLKSKGWVGRFYGRLFGFLYADKKVK